MNFFKKLKEQKQKAKLYDEYCSIYNIILALFEDTNINSMFLFEEMHKVVAEYRISFQKSMGLINELYKYNEEDYKLMDEKLYNEMKENETKMKELFLKIQITKNDNKKL